MQVIVKKSISLYFDHFYGSLQKHVMFYFPGPYLVVITNRKKIGEINGHPIYKVTGTEVLTYKKTTLHMNETQVSICHTSNIYKLFPRC